MDAYATEIFIDMLEGLIDERLAEVRPTRNGHSESNGYLNVKDAAAYLACPKSRIYDLVQLGKVTPHRDGKRLLFRPSDLDACLDGGSA